MIEKGVYRFRVVSGNDHIDILRPVPDQESDWGVLACIKETPVGKLIPVVSGEDMSHALHGRILPLRRSIGREPQHILKKLKGDWTCSLIKTCILARPDICKPHQKMPHCYNPPGHEGLPAHAIATVIRAWVDGRYVVVVEGAEFSY